MEILKEIEANSKLRYSNTETYKHLTYNTLIEGLSARNYNYYDAIGELIDNCLSNPFINPITRQPETVIVNVIYTPDYLFIGDNGIGRNGKGLAESMNYGKLSNIGNSRFGIGLKQAAPFFGNIIDITTKQYGSNEVFTYHLDKEWIRNNPKSLEQCPISIKVGNAPHLFNDHFFQIKITNLNHKPNDKTISNIKRELSICFSVYILQGLLRLVINGETVQPPKRPKLVKKFDFDLTSYGIKGIKGWWGIHKKGTPGRTKVFGAHTYFGGRLTTQGDLDIIRATKHPQYYRLEAEIYFDKDGDFRDNITSSKNGWIQDETYCKMRDIFYQVITEKFNQELAKVEKIEMKKETKDTLTATSKVLPTVLRNLFPELRKPKVVTRRAKEDEEQLGETEFPIEQREPGDESGGSGDTRQWRDKRNPKKVHIVTRPYTKIYVDGIEYEIQLSFENTLDESSPRYYATVNEEQKSITIEINMKHPYVILLNDISTEVLAMHAIEWGIEAVIDKILKINEVEKYIEEREGHIIDIDWEKTIKQINEIAWTDNQLEEMEEIKVEELT